MKTLLSSAILAATMMAAIPASIAQTYEYRTHAIRLAPSEPGEPSRPPACTPGVLVFTASGTFDPATEAPSCTTFHVLVVGGGAAPTNSGGGGGSGYISYGVVTNPEVTTVTVGAGGRGSPQQGYSNGGANGSLSAFGAITALGGRNSTSPVGGSGGSGGGGGSSSPQYSFGANGGQAGGGGSSSTYTGGTGQGASFFANFSKFTLVAITSGAGGKGHASKGTNSIGGAGGGGGVLVDGTGPSGGGNTGPLAGAGGQGYGGGGASGGWISPTYYASGNGAPGVVVVEWTN